MMNTNDFRDTPRIINNSITLREEDGCLVLGPDFKTILKNWIPFLFISESILFLAVILVIMLTFNQYGSISITYIVIAGIAMMPFLPLGVVVCFLGAKTLAKKKTLLLLSPEKITVKDSQGQEQSVEFDSSLEFSCDTAYDESENELFDVILHCRGTAYYVISGYDSDEMKTLCSLLTEYCEKQIKRNSICAKTTGQSLK